MDGTGDIKLSAISQASKDKFHMISLRGESKKVYFVAESRIVPVRGPGKKGKSGMSRGWSSGARYR